LTEIEINASLQEVWSVLTDWKKSNPDYAYPLAQIDSNSEIIPTSN
jgi:hypothetical protein